MVGDVQATDWDVQLPRAENACNNSVSDATGLVPNEAQMCFCPCVPLAVSSFPIAVSSFPGIGGHHSSTQGNSMPSTTQCILTTLTLTSWTPPVGALQSPSAVERGWIHSLTATIRQRCQERHGHHRCQGQPLFQFDRYVLKIFVVAPGTRLYYLRRPPPPRQASFVRRLLR